jgi:NAD(P)H-flavin reductase
MPSGARRAAAEWETHLLARAALAPGTYRLSFARPSGFTWLPGQRIRIAGERVQRDYSLASDAADGPLEICLRRIRGGALSPVLAALAPGADVRFSGPHGYFTLRSSGAPVVMVATGTGVAPFAGMAASGSRGFTLLHGVRHAGELYYASCLSASARLYVPCISGAEGARGAPGTAFAGRVTDYLAQRLRRGRYDFYLAGRSEMINAAIALIDERFPDSRVFTESFF